VCVFGGGYTGAGVGCACARVALLIQYATRRPHIVCALSASTTFLRHHLAKGKIFGRKVAEHKMCILISSTTSIRKCSHSKKKLARCCHKYEKTSSCKVPVIFVGCY
jgi:hypothetical protein